MWWSGKHGKRQKATGKSTGALSADSGSRGLKKTLKACLDREDLDGALTAGQQLADLPDVVTDAPFSNLLELAASSGGPMQYGKALLVCRKAEMELDVSTFCKLLVILTARLPCPAGMVRLTINMVLPSSMQAVPFVPEDATLEQELEVFEDGESGVLPIGAVAAPAASGRSPVLHVQTGHSPISGTYDARPLPPEHQKSPAAPYPVYRRRPQAGALGPFVYFWKGVHSPGGGWQISTELGAGTILGRHADASSKLPPISGWQRPNEEAWEDAPFEFRRAEETASSNDRSTDASWNDREEQQDVRKFLTSIDPKDLRGMVKGHDAAMTAYFGHFIALLHIEFLVELRSMQSRLRRPVEDLKRFGWTMDGLTVTNIFGRTLPSKKNSQSLPGKGESGTVRVAFSIPGSLPNFLRIRNGDSILLSRSHPMHDLIAEGSVAEAPNEEADSSGGSDCRIVVAVDGCDAINGKNCQGTFRIDKAANRTAYERQFFSLVKLASAKDSKRCPIWELLPLAGVGSSNVDMWADKMRQMLDEKQQAKLEGTANHQRGGLPKGASDDAKASRELVKLAQAEPEIAAGDRAWYAAEAEVKKSSDLNPSQKAAIIAAMGRRATLVQGPPGTGKTHVSVTLLQVMSRHLRMWPLLATSDSNVAVDNIAEGLMQRGIKVIRVGQAEKVRSQLDEITLEAIMRKRRLEQNLKEKGKGKGKGKDDDAVDLETEKHKRMEDFEAKLKVLNGADVICCTTITSGSTILEPFKFAAVLIDEVAQATEPSAIVPIVLRSAERLVLVGDHCQLPPSVCALEAETRGLSLSLFGRWAAQGLDPYFLDTQFRMHPAIANFSANQFYHGRLKTGVMPIDRPAPVGFSWPTAGTGMAFIHVGRPEIMDGDSRANPAEADTVSDILVSVLAAKELSVLEVGVVTPYAAQVRALRRKLQAELPRKLRGADVDLTGGIAGMQGVRALEIASVDAFQGREKELIVFSAVRSNAGGHVGFLADWRRLNVMITRARRGLIVIGNMDTLRSDPMWSKWLEWADEEGLVIRNSPKSQQQSAQRGMQSVAERSPAVPADDGHVAIETPAPETAMTPIQRTSIAEENELLRRARVSRASGPAEEIGTSNGDEKSKPTPMSPEMKGILAVLIAILAFNLYVMPLMRTLWTSE